MKRMSLCIIPILIFFLLNCSTTTKRVINKNIGIQFRIVDESPDSTEPEYVDKRNSDRVHLSAQVLFDQNDIESAQIIEGNFGGYAIILYSTVSSTNTFYMITWSNIGKRLGILIDNELVAAPKIMESISGGEIQLSLPGCSKREAIEIMNKITRR